MVDEKRILFVLICNNEIEAKQQTELFSKVQFSQIPARLKDFKFDMRVEIKNRNLASIYNRVQKNSPAKYKIFLTEPVEIFNHWLILSMVERFLVYPNFGILGIYGSEIPISGDYTQAKNIYGKFIYKENEKIQSKIGKTPIFFQEVHMIDSCFFATSQDISFDESMGDDFVVAAQCCRYRQAGYNVGVVYLEGVQMIFSKYSCDYKEKTDKQNYNLQLKKFRKTYKDIVTPLVSICIPTYNQPEFFEMTLQSALTQTYPNIEIIVGDDSTNKDTKKLIRPYLSRHDNIKYFYHGKPLGQKGLKNITFVLNKSSGEYVNLLFHDDIIVPEKISRMMDYFIRDFDNNIKLVVSTRMEINENNQVIGRKTPLQFLKDEVIDGEKVGRQIILTWSNFLGELSTSLIRKKDLITKDPLTGKVIFAIGTFCGVEDRAYGDMGTWFNLFKSGGKCVFLKDNLNISRDHFSANSHDPWIRLRLYVEWFNYLAIAWLNNLYLRDFNEYIFCCQRWLQGFDSEITPEKKRRYKTEEEIFLLKTVDEARDFVIAGKYPEVLDCSIRFLLNVLEKNNAIMPLVRKNSTTGLWEKANDGIMLHGEQRC